MIRFLVVKKGSCHYYRVRGRTLSRRPDALLRVDDVTFIAKLSSEFIDLALEFLDLSWRILFDVLVYR
jgi:hypothetical protein